MFKKFLLFSLICITSIQAQIIESDDIHEVVRHVYNTHDHQNVLVIFDYDNTLVEAKDGFGGDEWFCAMLDQCMNNGMSFKQSLDYVLPLYSTIQQSIWMEPVQKSAPQLVAFLQSIGIATMVLSSRSHPIIERTIEQLERAGMNFVHTAPSKETLTIDMGDRAFYRNGVLFSERIDKGKLLITFFEMINYKPEKVIFINDKMKHLKKVEAALQEANIPFVGIRYSRLDEKNASYDLKQHEDRLKHYTIEG